MHAMYLSEPNLTIIALKQIQFNLEQFFYEMKLEVFFLIILCHIKEGKYLSVKNRMQVLKKKIIRDKCRLFSLIINSR